MSQIINLGSGGSPAPGTYVETITGDLGGAVSPDLLGNINIITDNAGLGAGSTVLFLGTPINNTQTLVVTDVNNNTIMGADAGNLTLSGSSNTGFGYVSLAGLTSGSQNTAFGRSAGAANNSGSANTFVGFSAGANNTSASNNTSVGFEALRDNISGTRATAVGVGALRFSTANDNTAFGSGALQEVTGAGGFGNTAVGSSALASLNTGQNNIAVGSSSLGGNFNGSYNIGIASGLINPFTGTESSNILLNNEGVVGVSNRLIIGRATGTAAHQLSTAYIHGINGNTVANTQMVTIDSVTSQLGTQAIPTGTLSTLTGDTGAPVTPTAGNINLNAGLLFNLSGATVFFEGSSPDLVLNLTDVPLQNTFLGNNSGNTSTTGANNTALGMNSLSAITSGNNNTAFGTDALSTLSSSTGNTALGTQAGTAITVGAANTLVGFQSGLNLTTGNTNIFIGNLAGQNITTSGNNICIGSGGVLADSGVIRIGANGVHTSAYMQGVYGVTPGGTLNMAIIDNNGQLGSAALPTPTSYTYTNVATSPYVVLTTDQYISVDSSGGARTIRLPNAATLGKSFIIKDRAGTAATNNITITTVGGVVTIDGATSFVMNTAYQSVQIIGNSLGYEIF